MKPFIWRLQIAAVLLIVLCGPAPHASAVSYTFSQSGWEDGGFLSGTLEINETPIPDWPLPEVYYSSLISFHAHWSGNANSQSYDWGINDVGFGFVWNIETHSITSMALGTAVAYPIFVDGPTLIDYRAGGDQYRTTTTQPIVGHTVPDGSPTLLLMGIALITFMPLAVRTYCARN